MATITEDYVSFETAKLLKEEGFSENTICKYADVGGITEKWYDDYRERVLRFDWEEGYLIEPPIEPKDQYEIIGDTISAPTLQMAMKWLREVHNMYYEIQLLLGEKAEKYGDLKLGIYQLSSSGSYVWKDWIYADTYVELYENYIKYCLENLI